MSDIALKVTSDSTQARQDLGKLTDSVNKIESTTTKATKSLGQLALGFAAVFSGVSIVSYINRTSDLFVNLNNRINLVVDSTEQLVKVQKQLIGVSILTRSEFQNTVETYNRFGIALKNSSISSEKLLQVTELVQKAVALSGVQAESARAAIFQLGQGLAADALRGQELNSVLEQTPRIAQAIAEGLNASVGELRAIAEEGKLTANVVLEAIISQSEKLNSEFDRLAPTFAQATARLSFSIQRLIVELNTVLGITGRFSGSLVNIAKSIEAFLENLDIYILQVQILYLRLQPLGDALLATFRSIGKQLSLLIPVIRTVVQPITVFSNILRRNVRLNFLDESYISLINIKNELKDILERLGFFEFLDTRIGRTFANIFSSKSIIELTDNLLQLSILLDPDVLFGSGFPIRTYLRNQIAQPFFEGIKTLKEFAASVGLIRNTLFEIVYFRSDLFILIFNKALQTGALLVERFFIPVILTAGIYIETFLKDLYEYFISITGITNSFSRSISIFTKNIKDSLAILLLSASGPLAPIFLSISATILALSQTFSDSIFSTVSNSFLLITKLFSNNPFASLYKILIDEIVIYSLKFKTIYKIVEDFIKGIIKLFKEAYIAIVGGSYWTDTVKGIIHWAEILSGRITSIFSNVVKRITTFMFNISEVMKVLFNIGNKNDWKIEVRLTILAVAFQSKFLARIAEEIVFLRLRIKLFVTYINSLLNDLNQSLNLILLKINDTFNVVNLGIRNTLKNVENSVDKIKEVLPAVQRYLTRYLNIFIDSVNKSYTFLVGVIRSIYTEVFNSLKSISELLSSTLTGVNKIREIVVEAKLAITEVFFLDPKVLADFVDTIRNNLKEISSNLRDTFSIVYNGIPTKALQDINEQLKNILQGVIVFATRISGRFNIELDEKDIKGSVDNIIDYVKARLPLVVTGLTGLIATLFVLPEKAKTNLFNSLFFFLKLSTLPTLIDSIFDQFGISFFENTGELLGRLVATYVAIAIRALPDLINFGIELIRGIFTGLISQIPFVGEALNSLIKAITLDGSLMNYFLFGVGVPTLINKLALVNDKVFKTVIKTSDKIQSVTGKTGIIGRLFAPDKLSYTLSSILLILGSFGQGTSLVLAGILATVDVFTTIFGDKLNNFAKSLFNIFTGNNASTSGTKSKVASFLSSLAPNVTNKGIISNIINSEEVKPSLAKASVEVNKFTEDTKKKSSLFGGEGFVSTLLFGEGGQRNVKNIVKNLAKIGAAVGAVYLGYKGLSDSLKDTTIFSDIGDAIFNFLSNPLVQLTAIILATTGAFSALGAAIMAVIGTISLTVAALFTTAVLALGVIGVYLFGEGDSFFAKLDDVYEKLKRIFGFGKAERTKERLGALLPNVTIGTETFDFQARIQNLNLSKLSAKELESITKTAEDLAKAIEKAQEELFEFKRVSKETELQLKLLNKQLNRKFDTSQYRITFVEFEKSANKLSDTLDKKLRVNPEVLKKYSALGKITKDFTGEARKFTDLLSGGDLRFVDEEIIRSALQVQDDLTESIKQYNEQRSIFGRLLNPGQIREEAIAIARLVNEYKFLASLTKQQIIAGKAAEQYRNSIKDLTEGLKALDVKFDENSLAFASEKQLQRLKIFADNAKEARDALASGKFKDALEQQQLITTVQFNLDEIDIEFKGIRGFTDRLGYFIDSFNLEIPVSDFVLNFNFNETDIDKYTNLAKAFAKTQKVIEAPETELSEIKKALELQQKLRETSIDLILNGVKTQIQKTRVLSKLLGVSISEEKLAYLKIVDTIAINQKLQQIRSNNQKLAARKGVSDVERQLLEQESLRLKSEIENSVRLIGESIESAFESELQTGGINLSATDFIQLNPFERSEIKKRLESALKVREDLLNQKNKDAKFIDIETPAQAKLILDKAQQEKDNREFLRKLQRSLSSTFNSVLSVAKLDVPIYQFFKFTTAGERDELRQIENELDTLTTKLESLRNQLTASGKVATEDTSFKAIVTGIERLTKKLEGSAPKIVSLFNTIKDALTGVKSGFTETQAFEFLTDDQLVRIITAQFKLKEAEKALQNFYTRLDSGKVSVEDIGKQIKRLRTTISSITSFKRDIEDEIPTTEKQIREFLKSLNFNEFQVDLKGENRRYLEEAFRISEFFNETEVKLGKIPTNKLSNLQRSLLDSLPNLRRNLKREIEEKLVKPSLEDAVKAFSDLGIELKLSDVFKINSGVLSNIVTFSKELALLESQLLEKKLAGLSLTNEEQQKLEKALQIKERIKAIDEDRRAISEGILSATREQVKSLLTGKGLNIESLLTSVTDTIVGTFANRLNDYLFKNVAETLGTALGISFDDLFGGSELGSNASNPMYVKSVDNLLNGPSGLPPVGMIRGPSGGFIPKVDPFEVDGQAPGTSIGDVFDTFTKDLGNILSGDSPFLKGFGDLLGNLGTNISGLFSGGGSGFLDSIGTAFTSFRNLLPFADGGVIPNSPTGSMPILAHAGEIILNEAQQARVASAMQTPGTSQQVVNINITGDISRQTKSEIYKMLPSIAEGVNSHNREKGYR